VVTSKVTYTSEVSSRRGRIELRAIKKQNNRYPLLMKPKTIAKDDILKSGHPKKK